MESPDKKMRTRSSAARDIAWRIRHWFRTLPGTLWFGIVVLSLFVIRPVVRVRLANFDPYRVGEFISRIDMAIALLRMEEPSASGRSRNYFVIPRTIANEQLRAMYCRSLDEMPEIELLDCRTSRTARLLNGPARRLTVDSSTRRRFVSLYCGAGEACMDLYGPRPSGRPLISFTAGEIERGWELLEPLGIGPTTKYVCLHVRDSAYLEKAIPDHDWSHHNYRNPPIETFVPMVEQVLDRGYKVIRMGKIVQGPFPVQREGFIDYGVLSAKSDFLDVFLYAHAVLAIAGSVSGIDQLGHAFNVPSVATSFVPFNDPRWATDSALVIPAMIRDAQTGELVSLSRMVASRFGSSLHYREHGLEVVPNGAAEISQVVEEGILRLEGSWIDTPDSIQRQLAFWTWAEECGVAADIPPGPWDSAHHRARIGSAFLQQYSQQLFQ